MVFLAAPWLSPDGTVGGLAFGILDLSKFSQIVERHQTIPGATVVVLDQHNRAIYASDGSSYKTQQDLSDDELVRASQRAPDGIYQYTPKAGTGPWRSRSPASARQPSPAGRCSCRSHASACDCSRTSTMCGRSR